MFTMGLVSEMRTGRDGPSFIGCSACCRSFPITIFHARKTYQALGAGYTFRDLRAALAAWQQERREELAFELGERESAWAKAMRGVTYSLVAGVGFPSSTELPHTLLTGSSSSHDRRRSRRGSRRATRSASG